MADITISKEELNDPAIDDVVNLQKSVQNLSGKNLEEIRTPFYYNPAFYYSFACAIGALACAALSEAFYDERSDRHQMYHSIEEVIVKAVVGDYLLFGPMAGVLGLSIGLIYGAVNRNFKKALHAGLVSMGVALGATILTTIVAEAAYIFGSIPVHSIVPQSEQEQRMLRGDYPLYGIAFVIQMSVRAIAWSLVSMSAGIGLGVALKSKKLSLNGFVGGMVGGLIGGLLFDPIHRFIGFGLDSGAWSRLIACTVVGIFVGLFIGIFENLSKEAWFLMLKGPLTGKQFIIFKSPMLIGSSPKSEVYLFKDPDIAPLHATVTKNGSRFLLKDAGSEKGTFVNGRKIDSYVLQNNDTITIGEAVLKYSEKQRG